MTCSWKWDKEFRVSEPLVERDEEGRPISYSPFATACLPGVNFQEGMAIKMQREKWLQMSWVPWDKKAFGIELLAMAGSEICSVAARFLVFLKILFNF